MKTISFVAIAIGVNAVTAFVPAPTTSQHQSLVQSTTTSRQMGLFDFFNEDARKECEAKREREIEEQDDRDPIFKKLFRSIVVKCHPDKLGTLNTEDQKYYNNLYGDAIDANETINWALLIRTAIKLEIEIPEGVYSKIEEIQADLDKLKAKQEAILNSTSWNWYNIKDTNNQDELLKNHLNFLKGFNSI